MPVTATDYNLGLNHLSMLCIVARFEEHTLRWPLPQSEVPLGASAENDIVLPFPGVSRRHALVSSEGTQVRLVDLASKNGLIVRGQRCSETVLGIGDSVQIGLVVLTVQDGRTSEVDLALRVEPREAGRPRLEKTTSNGQSGDEIAGILRVVRLAEDPSRLTAARRRALLDEARSVLGAVSLAVGRLASDGDVDIESASGPLPDADAIAAIRRTMSSRRRGDFHGVQSRGETHFVCAGRGERFVAVTLARMPEEWVEELVAILAGKLVHSAPAPVPEDRTEDLKIPEGMVIGDSRPMQQLTHQMRATVGSGMDVLLLGETGTGKELFAQIVHASGPTSGGPFLAINCAAIPSELLEAQLFGVHGRVATGVDPRPGMFQQADHGSIFLDEIGELAQHLQAKLLRVLQEREVQPIGAARPRAIDVRVISASNRDLASLVADGRFRADLYYRLCGLQFEIPPLRERKEDIAALVLEFVGRAAKEFGKDIRGVSRKALRRLEQHEWPGNVRQLENEVRRAVLVCPQGSSLQSEHFARVQTGVVVAEGDPVAEAPEPTLREQVGAVERTAIERALIAAQGNRSLAARMLGLTRNGLALKLRRLHR